MTQQPSLTFPIALANHLREIYDLQLFVETGTLSGRTSAFCSSIFKHVFSVELDPHQLYLSRRLACSNNVDIYFGSSPYVLPMILPQLDAPTLFWLDAHWSGGRMPRLGYECPLLNELRAIGGLRDNDVVLIDDARLFVNQPDPPHRPEEWPNYEDIQQTFCQWANPIHVQVIDDAIVVAREELQWSTK